MPLNFETAVKIRDYLEHAIENDRIDIARPALEFVSSDEQSVLPPVLLLLVAEGRKALHDPLRYKGSIVEKYIINLANILSSQKDPAINEIERIKLINSLLNCFVYRREPYPNNVAERKFFLLAEVLSANEMALEAFWQEPEKINGFLNLFYDVTVAEKFLEDFYAKSSAVLKFEAALELGTDNTNKGYLDIIRRITSDTDKATEPENIKSLRALIEYLPLTLKLFKSLEDMKDNKQKANRILDLLATSTSIGQGDVDLSVSASTVQPNFDKVYTEQKHRWLQSINDYLSGTIRTKDLIALCKQLVTSELAYRYSLPLETVAKLVAIGVSTESIAKFSEAKPQNSDTQLPNVVVSEDNYFICKLSYDDPIGPFLGLVSGCCQHLDGEGCTTALYGYTQSNSCFYVMFKGKAPPQPIDTKLLKSKDIVAQSCAWRQPNSDAIVLDSIEMEHADNEERQRKVGDMFNKLAVAIVEEEVTRPVSGVSVKRVIVGEGGLRNLGFNVECDYVQIPDNPWYITDSTDKYQKRKKIYTDAGIQRLLYSREQAARIILEQNGELDESSFRKITDPKLLLQIFVDIISMCQSVDARKNKGKYDQLIVNFLEYMSPSQRESLEKMLKTDNIFSYMFSVGIKLYDNNSLRLLLKEINSDVIELEKLFKYDEKMYKFELYLYICLLGPEIVQGTTDQHMRLYESLIQSRISLNPYRSFYDAEIKLFEAHPELLAKDRHLVIFNSGTVACVQIDSTGCGKSMGQDKRIQVDNLLAALLTTTDDSYYEKNICRLMNIIMSADYNLHELLKELNDVSKSYPMIIALEHGYEDRVNTILRSASFTIDLLEQKDKDGDNVLIAAIKNGCGSVVQTILGLPDLPQSILVGAEEKINGSQKLDHNALLALLRNVKNPKASKKITGP